MLEYNLYYIKSGNEIISTSEVKRSKKNTSDLYHDILMPWGSDGTSVPISWILVFERLNSRSLKGSALNGYFQWTFDELEEDHRPLDIFVWNIHTNLKDGWRYKNWEMHEFWDFGDEFDNFCHHLKIFTRLQWCWWHY